jgi:hypothetical protein
VVIDDTIKVSNKTYTKERELAMNSLTIFIASSNTSIDNVSSHLLAHVENEVREQMLATLPIITKNFTDNVIAAVSERISTPAKVRHNWMNIARMVAHTDCIGEGCEECMMTGLK